MKILIDNNDRIFQVKTSTGKQAFGNLEHLNDIINNLGTHAGYFKVYHFWNNKAEKLSSKALKQMFEANQLKQNFIY
jgi:hypothetical protein